MSQPERETWAWYARWATVVRAFAVAEREGLPAGPGRMRRARQVLEPLATDEQLDALMAHLRGREAAGDRAVFDPPRLVDLAGPEMAARIVEAGLIEGAVAERELQPAAAADAMPAGRRAR